MPAQRESNDLLRVNWTISGSDYKSCEDIGHNSDSSQQHARTGGVNLSVTCELDYISGSDYKSCEDIGHNSDSSQQHARTGGVKLSLTCELDYLRFGQNTAPAM